MRKVAPVVIVALALALLPVLAALAATIIQISEDPYTNPDSQHKTQVEPDTYAFGSTVVSAFQTGRYFDGGASNNGWATSLDGGATWADGTLPSTTVHSTPPGPYDRVSDPSVAYDAEHDVWMISSLAIDNGVGVAVLTSRSTNGGLTWGAPVVVSSKPGGFYDKNWIACDNTPSSPFYGNCYTEWDDAFLGNQFFMSTSSDGGLTWGPKKSPSSGSGLGGIPLTLPNGRALVPAWSVANQIIVFGSNNGGGSWGPSRVISNIQQHTVAGGLRAGFPLPSGEVDGGGRAFVVWSDCRFRAGCSANDIVMTSSRNGRRWTPIVRIPIDPTNSGVDHFLPGLAVDPTSSGPNARLGLTYYYYPNASCSFATCQLHVGFISSDDAGTTWSAPQTLAGPISLSWIADTSQGRMVGDYISTSFSGANAVPVFSNASAPIGGVFQQASWSSMLPVTADQAYPLKVGIDPVLSTKFDHPARSVPIVTP